MEGKMKKLKGLALIALLVLAAFQVEAKTPEKFLKRFQIIRAKDGTLIGIRDRTLPTSFKVRPYVEMVKSQLLNEQSKIEEKGNYEQEVRDLLSADGQDEFLTNDQYEQNVQTVLDSLKKLAALNVDKIFSQPIFQDVVAKYESKMTELLLMADPSIVAVVGDPTFFYKRNVTYQAVTWGLDLARKKLSNIPILNTVSYVIVEVQKLITERRNFHQNMLLHYLENFDEKELGLTHAEVNLVWSSIYESRIDWFAFWESKNAVKTWNAYGINNFYSNYRLANQTLYRSQKLYSGLNERINFAFEEVTLNNDKVIVNLFDNEGMFKNYPAIAMNLSKPTQVSRKRTMLTIAELGLSFVPISVTIRDAVTNFMRSFYAKQKITEGALYGYFESTANQAGMKHIEKQYMNPFEVSLKL
jgi:hypothetical protein